MKQLFKISIPAILLMLTLPGCTLFVGAAAVSIAEGNWPVVYVILNVEPDDAIVLVNGEFIGEAHDFSKRRTSFRVTGRSSRITIKKEGYKEEVIDPFEYVTPRIMVVEDVTDPYQPTVPIIKVRLKLQEKE